MGLGLTGVDGGLAVANAIVQALEQAAERIGKTLSKDAGKAVEDMYRSAGKGTEDVIKRIGAADAEHAGKLVELAENLGKRSGSSLGADAARSAESGDLRNRISSMLEPEGEFSRGALHDRPSFDEQYAQELSARGLSQSEHDRLRLSPTNLLTEDEAKQVIDVRQSITAEDGQVMTKVLHPDAAEHYLNNDAAANGRPFNPGGFGGSIARGTDTAHLDTPASLRDGLALDDHGQGWSPVQEGATSAYQLRFRAPEEMNAQIPFGGLTQPVAEHVGNLAGEGGIRMDAPFTGTGYTAGGVPEWSAGANTFGGRAEIWQLGSDGKEQLAGIFDHASQRWTRL
jgi:hypothetical protein